MIICPNCKTENRPGAKYCTKCASPLPQPDPHTTIPVSEAGGSGSTKKEAPIFGIFKNRPSNVKTAHTNTRPLAPGTEFLARPPGAIFGNRYSFQSLLFSDDHQASYLVTQLAASETDKFRQCPNPACGAIYHPQADSSGKYCTACDTPLDSSAPVLVLTEANSPIPDNILKIISLGFEHGSIRAPVDAFEEKVGGQTRYCLVSVQVSHITQKPEPAQVLSWGRDLADGLDLMHLYGVSFDGMIDSSIFRLDGNHAVWADFSTSKFYPEGNNQAFHSDLLALATQLYVWLTGTNQYQYNPNLAPAVNKLFEQVFTPPGFNTGGELAQAIDQALQGAPVAMNIDINVGRRTSVGRVRTLNEDSILVFEGSKIQQSISQPVGVFVIADGMGGHAAGEIASGAIVSAIALKSSSGIFSSSKGAGNGEKVQSWLNDAVDEANRSVFDMRKAAGTDMGSTLVMAVVDGNKAYIAHVGDSRAYLINQQGIQQITTDHSLVQRLVATGQITREQARHHPQRNVIYRTMGDKPKAEMDTSIHPLAPGDVLLLCSDGLSGMVDDASIFQIISQAGSAQEACDQLVEQANRNGGEDNISAIVIKVI